MKKIILLLLSVFSLTSCQKYYQVKTATDIGTEIVGGKNTSYTNDYQFDVDKIVSDDIMLSVEKYMENIKWNISQENTNRVTYEYESAPIGGDAANVYQHGYAHFTLNDETLDLNLQLRGNYQFGTKKNSQRIYEDLKDYLYGETSLGKNNKHN